MKKLILLAPAILLAIVFVASRSNKTPDPAGSGVDRNSENIAGSQASKLEPSQESRPSGELKEQDSNPDRLVLAHRGEVMSPNLDHPGVAHENDGRERVSPATAISSQAPLRLLDSSGPTIGTVKVLGHRGCDTNTQGWYLGKGKPDEYDYTESDDGETLVVQPNVQNLTGAFEFVHCVDANQIAGKHIQFRVRLKAQDVKDVAQLRFWGENPSRERILFKSEKVTGTYDWKDFAIEADVPSEVTLFNYGITFKNSGKLWVSHPVFGVNP
jgi:hypothetical protein